MPSFPSQRELFTTQLPLWILSFSLDALLNAREEFFFAHAAFDSTHFHAILKLRATKRTAIKNKVTNKDQSKGYLLHWVTRLTHSTPPRVSTDLQSPHDLEDDKGGEATYGEALRQGWKLVSVHFRHGNFALFLARDLAWVAHSSYLEVKKCQCARFFGEVISERRTWIMFDWSRP